MKILTQNNLELDDYLAKQETSKPFDKRVLEFISSFSQRILSNKELRQYPDIIALAFWMRGKTIEGLKQEFFSKYPNRVPCGTVCHFAPSNVDTIFVYSLFISLMLGNKNIVRISFKNSEERNILIDEINRTLNDGYEDILKYLMVLTYPHDEKITHSISSKSNLRVIWGGDRSVQEISKVYLPSTSNEIKFANKYSIAVLKASEVERLESDKTMELATKLANDIYWFGQQGCSSPKTVVWYDDLAEGKHLSDVKIKLYQAVTDVVRGRFINEIQDSDYINKIVACDEIASLLEDSKIISDALLTRVVIKDSDDHNLIRGLNCGSGLLVELDTETLNTITDLIDRTTQTVSYFGFEIDELKAHFDNKRVYPDRLVPVGKALEFSTHWDGYDLLVSMTRGVYYE